MGRLQETTTSFDVVQAVAREAQIGLAVLGSVAKAGDTIRISARLQDANTGEVLASERVEGEGEASIFTMVDELTRRIRNRFDVPLVVDIGPETTADRALAEVTTNSVEAYRYYAEGVRLHEEQKEQEAVPLLQRAVELDPDFAMALAKLSVVHGNLGDLGKAQDFAGQALEHTERLSRREQHYIEGRFNSLQPGKMGEAVDAYRKAVELFPDHTAARNNLANLYVELEQHDDAIQHLEELRRRGMTFPGTYNSLAGAYAATGDVKRGQQVLREYVGRFPKTLGVGAIWAII